MKPKKSKQITLQTLHDKEMHVKRGGSLKGFSPAEVRELEEYALDTRDSKLWDLLQLFWIM